MGEAARNAGTQGEARGHPRRGLRRTRPRVAGAIMPYCEMPWQKALETIRDVKEFYLDIPGFSPGTTVYEAKFPSGQEGTRMVHSASQMRDELDEIHVDIGVLFPDHFLKIPVISQVDYASASPAPTTPGSSRSGVRPRTP